jgi:phage shock protein B
MQETLLIVTIPIILFTIVVAPIWLLLHYRSKRRAEAALSEEEREELELLAERIERMQERIETLESILDAQAPRWRDQPASSR